jgi:hypothetical protein
MIRFLSVPDADSLRAAPYVVAPCRASWSSCSPSWTRRSSVRCRRTCSWPRRPCRGLVGLTVPYKPGARLAHPGVNHRSRIAGRTAPGAPKTAARARLGSRAAPSSPGQPVMAHPSKGDVSPASPRDAAETAGRDQERRRTCRDRLPGQMNGNEHGDWAPEAGSCNDSLISPARPCAIGLLSAGPLCRPLLMRGILPPRTLGAPRHRPPTRHGAESDL